MDNKNQITLVRLVDPSIQRDCYGPVSNGFQITATYLLSVGDISCIIKYDNELILACQDGLFVADMITNAPKNQTSQIINELLVTKMGSLVKKKVHLSEEKYLRGERISQVALAGDPTQE